MSQQQPFQLNPRAQPFYPSKKESLKLRPEAQPFYPARQVLPQQVPFQPNSPAQPFVPFHQVPPQQQAVQFYHHVVDPSHWYSSHSFHPNWNWAPAAEQMVPWGWQAYPTYY